VTLDPAVVSHYRLRVGRVLGDRASGTWEAFRGGTALVLKHFDAATFTDFRYPLRVAAALRAQGWPTPEPVDEPLTGPGGAWVLFHRLPGRPPERGEAEQRARGRLLAELHAAAAATGIAEQRGGFTGPAELLADPELDRGLRSYESAHPEAGGLLRRAHESASAWFAEHSTADAPRSVIHGDFAPWNLLFDGGRLTGVVDFEGTHLTFQVADFALSWRGYQDEVLRGYDEVRPLSDLEWHLVRPVFHAWLFIGLKDALAATDPPNLDWPLAHLHKHSDLLDRRTHRP
jgi:aminoglycoside phosphotransferase (APT) family kinase protein